MVRAPRIEWAQLREESTRVLEGPVVQGVHCTRDPAEGRAPFSNFHKGTTEAGRGPRAKGEQKGPWNEFGSQEGRSPARCMTVHLLLSQNTT